MQLLPLSLVASAQPLQVSISPVQLSHLILQLKQSPETESYRYLGSQVGPIHFPVVSQDIHPSLQGISQVVEFILQVAHTVFSQTLY